MLPGDTVKFPQVAFGLIPKVLNAIDVVLASGKQRGVVNPQVAEARHRQRIVARQRVAIDDGIRHDPFFQDGQQGCALVLAITTA